MDVDGVWMSVALHHKFGCEDCELTNESHDEGEGLYYEVQVVWQFITASVYCHHSGLQFCAISAGSACQDNGPFNHV